MTNTNGFTNSAYAEAALNYLNTNKPTDGWVIDTFLDPKETSNGGKRVRLLRRNVTISANFEDIALDTLSSCVVGIVKSSSLKIVVAKGTEKLMGEGVVLVEKDGTVCRKPRSIPVTLTLEPKSPTSAKPSRNTTRTKLSRKNTNTNAPPPMNIDPATQQQIITYLICTLLGIVILKIIMAALASFLIFFIPLFFFAKSTCPPDDSFDAKKELKRVLRGVHLPDDDPRKPKSWLEKTVSRVTASVATELATGLGYELSLLHLGGLATVATVKVDVANVECFWIGAFNKWFYIRQRNLNAE